MASVFAMATGAGSDPYKVDVTVTEKLITCYVTSDLDEPFVLGGYVYCIAGLVVHLHGGDENVAKLAQFVLKKTLKPVYLNVNVPFDVVTLFRDIIGEIELA